MSEQRKKLTSKERIVVKIGTSSLTFRNGKTNYTRLEKLAMVLSDLMSCGKEIVLVTSGAIGVGAGSLSVTFVFFQLTFVCTAIRESIFFCHYRRAVYLKKLSRKNRKS